MLFKFLDYDNNTTSTNMSILIGQYIKWRGWKLDIIGAIYSAIASRAPTLITSLLVNVKRSTEYPIIPTNDGKMIITYTRFYKNMATLPCKCTDNISQADFKTFHLLCIINPEFIFWKSQLANMGVTTIHLFGHPYNPSEAFARDVLAGVSSTDDQSTLEYIIDLTANTFIRYESNQLVDQGDIMFDTI